MIGLFEKYSDDPKEYTQIHLRVPKDLYEQIMAIKKQEKISSVSKLITISFKLLVDSYKKEKGIKEL